MRDAAKTRLRGKETASNAYIRAENE